MAQSKDGSWGDWQGVKASVEATGYCLEIAACIARDLLGDEWCLKATDFVVRSQGDDGGWGMSPADESSPWVTHSIVVAIAAALGSAGPVAPALPAGFFPESVANMESAEKSHYDFALSFSGSDREYASALAFRLRENGATVFYDRYETSALWGGNLIDTLTDIYRNRADFCLMLISGSYLERAWPRLERQSAQTRALVSESTYILPILLERDIALPGLIESTGYLCAWEHDIDALAALAMEKLHVLRRRHGDGTLIEPGQG